MPSTATEEFGRKLSDWKHPPWEVPVETDECATPGDVPVKTGECAPPVKSRRIDPRPEVPRTAFPGPRMINFPGTGITGTVQGPLGFPWRSSAHSDPGGGRVPGRVGRRVKRRLESRRGGLADEGGRGEPAPLAAEPPRELPRTAPSSTTVPQTYLQ